MLSRTLPDRFILWLLATVAVGTLLPVHGLAAEAVDWLTLAAIFTLFFLHGARLPREALLGGLTDWRLHLAILGMTFLIFPLCGVALSHLFPSLLSPMLWTGLLFLCALPSTVQSSIAYTSLAGGNVAGAVAAAAFSNLIGVFLTPALVGLMLETQGAQISFSGIGKIVLLLFLPFVLGHGLRRWIFPVIKDRPTLTTIVDKGTILLAVYGAFSAAAVERLWTRIPPGQIGIVFLFCGLLLAAVLAAAWSVGRAFPRESRAAILFCGSVKSLASGAPMARILFPGAAAGIVLLPIMLFHAMQLIVCAWIAARMARRL
ncbi:bile acid:sodium symporter family protein [Sphingosinicella sp. BN140058]|uniref:bile acid:sodium symporter family protein n=1 Tax=Sphingosinicella sp. BN140058 TaxID=1892855 RepID=UPI001FB0A4C1|nr:bile acid:sodium symporter family protein [Sphingosinicella sp. BN140058]